MVNWNEWPMWGFYFIVGLFAITMVVLPFEDAHPGWWETLKERWDAWVRSLKRSRRK